MSGTLSEDRAWPRTGIGVVLIREIMAKSMALPLRVITPASSMPARLTSRCQMVRMVSPGVEKGRKSHKKAMKPLTRTSLFRTFSFGSLAKSKETRLIAKAMPEAEREFRPEVIRIKIRAVMSFALGSALWISELPWLKLSSNISNLSRD